jgi:hypothetical protein
MDFNALFEFFAPLFLIFCGVMAKSQHNDPWSKLKPYWLYFIIIGSLLLILKILKYWVL